MNNPQKCLYAGLVLIAGAVCARAGTFSANFDSAAVPSGSTLYGNSFVDSSGGVGNSGCLKLTTAVNGQSGSIVLDDLDNGNPIYGFDIAYDVLLGRGTDTPADGMSVCFGPDLPNGTWSEEGTGSGLSFSFDTYDNGSETPLAPSIDVAVGNTKLATSKRTIATITSNDFVHVHILLNADGSMFFQFRGETLLTNWFLPDYQDLVNAALPGRFGMSARTGGLNEDCWVDNLQITTFTQPLVGISQQPRSQTVVQGDNATFYVAVGNTNNVTFQWSKNGTPIAGATDTALVVSDVQAADSGSVYTVAALGPNNTATSTGATLTVTNLTLPATPQVSFTFDDGTVPAGTAVYGSAAVDTSGGVNGTGALKLTTAVNSEYGAFVISDPAAGAPVYGFTARFQAAIGGGTTPPADGFAFAFSSDMPADPTSGAPQYEEGYGLGSGLLVTFDIYNNDTIYGVSNPAEAQPAPSIDVRYGGTAIATVQLPISIVTTGVDDNGNPAFDDTIIQLNTDGTLTVVYRGALFFTNLPIPGFSSMTGGQFALAARTGGLNENFWFDNLEITTVTASDAVRITTQPASQSILVNHAATFSAAVNDPTGVTYQWMRNGTAITGAIDSSYTLAAVALSDDQAAFTVQATKGAVQVTSSPAVLTVVNLTAPASPQLVYTFDDGNVPAGTSIYGNAYVDSANGVNGTGCLHLTDAVNGQASAFVVDAAVQNGAQVAAISVAFDVREGGGSGSPADGFSFNWDTSANLPDSTIGGAETGTGNGVSLCFRRYIGSGNSDTPPSPYIGIKYQGAFIASTQIPGAQLDTDTTNGPAYRTMLFRVDANGKAYLAYGERVLYNGLQLPNFTYIASSKFAFYGRTGGQNNNQWFDNIKIQATKSSGPLTIVTQPANQTILVGKTATFSALVSDPTGVTYQWYKNGSAITGANGSAYTTPAEVLADNGARFNLAATGPGGSATSSNGLLTVVAPITIHNPVIDYTFADGLVPDGCSLNNNGGGYSGYITADGGPGNNGCLHLCDAQNSQEGTFVVPDLSNDAAVSGFTMYFSLMMSGGSAPPADGVSVSFCSSNEAPATVLTGEGGAGSGLIVILDVYNGANPYVGLTWHGTSVARTYVPYTVIDSAGAWADMFIRLNPSGTVDVQYNGQVLFNQVALPNYAAVAGNVYVFGARTGGLNENEWISNLEIAPMVGLTAVPITYQVTRAGLVLSWPGSGYKLQSAPSLGAANWTDVSGGTVSPCTALFTSAAQFFRLVAQ